jgi:CheY-like chemotaxis protein
MLVDNEPDVAALLKRGLESSGLEVDAFNDPLEALKAFRPDKYALLVTDIKMAGMTGFELYREVRTIDGRIRVIFMTAFEIYHDDFVRMFPDVDVRCFISKPVSIERLVDVVTEELPRAYSTEA